MKWYFKGNYVANKSNPRQERSKTIYDCVDIMGTIRKHGEQYERPNGRFKYRCNNGMEEIEGKSFPRLPIRPIKRHDNKKELIYSAVVVRFFLPW